MAVGLTACETETFDVEVAPEERAIATVRDIVAEVVRHYTDDYRGGEMRAFAVAGEFQGGPAEPPSDEGLRLIVQDGWQHMTEELSSDQRTVWFLQIMPETVIEEPWAWLHIAVYDLHHPGMCCHLIGVRLARDANGAWQLEDVFYGGAAHETDAQREERLRRGADVPR